ncbi:LANO_0B04324g1_1 [Lachancea nothofagi CBS 11611]|uniref:LANO_0B04324g1_1 n=1 Tax=Lachancea nothofagi CBS 11611 TaxID=1266666 RepID=A0A1G4IXI2_9SACH|nr:LANO_0B04324g1_1 [Lachancea nothofagi CBS 11611]
MHFECLQDSPKDYISSLLVLEKAPHVVATAWDGTLSLYDYEANELLLRMKHENGLLSSVWSACGKKYVGSVQGDILEVDLESERFELVSEEATLGICAMSSNSSNLVAGSWDGSLQMLDMRTGSIWHNEKLGNGKILALDSNDETVVVSYAGGKVVTYDQRNMNTPVIRDSGLKFQTRDIKLMPQGNGYVQSSLDGRVAVEYLNDESLRFAFRCHRMNLPDTQFVFPVNALAFSPTNGHLYTGGSDGKVFAWNLNTRKKSEELPKLDESVVRLAISSKVLCVATADDSFKTLATIQDAETQSGQIYFTKL